MKDLIYDVVVVGFGPTGAVAAALLGQLGLRVCVLDKSRTLYDRPRAVAMDHEIMRVFQSIGLGDKVSAHTEPFTLSEHFGASGQLMRRVGMLPPPYPMGWTPSMTFRQPVVEQLIRDRVSTIQSVDIALGRTLKALEQNSEEVILTLAEEDGRVTQLKASYVIGCDGASSTVRSMLDIELDDLGFDEPWLVIDLLAKPSGIAKLPQVSSHFCDPKRPAMYVVCTGNHRRWEIMLKPGEVPRDMESEENVWKQLARWISPCDATLWRAASYRFHALIAKEWRKERVFLAGDAAHQQPPFLGQGMCQGIRDATNLAWKLGSVLLERSNVRLLDTYAQERSAHVRSLTAQVLRIGRYICELDPESAEQRDKTLLEQSGGAVETVLRQDLMPKLTTGMLSKRAHPAIGSLFPQPWVRVGNEFKLLDDVTPKGWRLVLFETDYEPAKTDIHLSVVRISSVRNIASGFDEKDDVLESWFKRCECVVAIVRPDNYVYGVYGATELESADQDIKAIKDWLQIEPIEHCLGV